MAGLIGRLDDAERESIRVALRAMTPEMHARVEGQCFRRKVGILAYTNNRGRCVLMCAFDTDTIVGEREMADFLPEASTYDVYEIAHVNDRGWLATRAAVRELLSLAD